MRGGELNAICTWSFGGKDTSENFAQGGKGGQIFDIAAGARPVNHYLYGDMNFPEPFNRNEDPDEFKPGRPTEPRQQIELDAYRSPGDKASRQTGWPLPDHTRSSYDDVGTSYHAQLTWLSKMEEAGTPFQKAYNEGMRRFRLASNFNPSRFVFLFDQTGDVATASEDEPRMPDEYKNVGIMGEFGEMNKSVMSFFDSHADYVQIEVHEANTEDYELYFRRRTDD
jgi:hypothetical protein